MFSEKVLKFIDEGHVIDVSVTCFLTIVYFNDTIQSGKNELWKGIQFFVKLEIFVKRRVERR